ncbi:MAG: hypothetical protein ACR2H3_14785 [Acidimicrobiales bacterium]
MTAVRAQEDRVKAGQERALALYIRRVVAPHSPLHGPELRGNPVRGIGDLSRIAARRLCDIEPEQLVLKPTPDSITSGGDLSLAARMVWAQVTRSIIQFNRDVVEPAFKPIHWMLSDEVPVGSTADDLERLGEIGRAGLEHAGLTSEDSLAMLDLDPSGLPFWQISLGARRAGIGVLHTSAEDEETLLATAPTVVVGPTASLIAAAGGSPRIRAVIATDGPLDDVRRGTLAGIASRVISLWTPPGARSAWFECTEATGFHTWPATEIVQVADDGELLWTPIQWKGSVLLRTRTGASGVVVDERCGACGRTGSRVVPTTIAPRAAGGTKPKKPASGGRAAR